MKAIPPLFVLICIVLCYEIFCEYVEFYPSQALLDSSVQNIHQSKHNILKRQVNNNKISSLNQQNNNTSDLKLRHFNAKQSFNKNTPSKRSTDTVFRGHPKTREELWNEHFINETNTYDQTSSLIKLVHNVTLTYLTDCTPVILYDNQVKSKESYLFQNLLRNFPITFVHGYINDNNTLAEPKIARSAEECLHFILFLTDVTRSSKVLGKQSNSRVVVVARSSQWAVQEFLAGSLSRMFINLLVIAQSFREGDDETLDSPYILYTHKLYTDGLGSSQSVVLNSWTHGKFSRDVNLFPPKMTKGYAGHRFVVSAANQPPFVIRRVKTDADGGNPRVTWDGVEIRLLRMLAVRNNFSIEIVEPRDQHLGSGDAVAKEIAMGRADIGVAGMYRTTERQRDMDLTFAHSQDCAAFVTLMSTALPRYRAILGPFHWHVWVALTFTYLFAIFPLAFSDKHTLRHLLENSGEVENMFWYVFGTFTNCFTFLGKNSWSKTTKITTRLLIGWYWIFTIIITSCYTGSIIAFVTLPMFPETVDSIEQLLKGFYRVGTLDRGGWERWFFNSSDDKTNKLLKKLELVPDVKTGIRNTTKAFFWPYAFLGSRSELEYIVQANFTVTKSKRAMLHISNECFVPFGIIMGFPNNSLYTAKLSGDVRRIVQSGLIDKIVDEVRWEIQRSATGGFLSVGKGSLKVTSVEEKGLTLEDTQGMFLLLAAGFLLAATALISEWMGGFTRRCRRNRKKVTPPTNTESREKLVTTPKSDIDSEVKIISDKSNSHLNYETESTSLESTDTLEGHIINVTGEGITLHTNFDSRRSSSVDLDREVREIFEKDESRKRIIKDALIEVRDNDDDDVETVSNHAFGYHVK